MGQWNSYWFLEPEQWGTKILICLTKGFHNCKGNGLPNDIHKQDQTAPSKNVIHFSHISQRSSTFFGCDKQRHADVKLSLGRRGGGPNPGAQKEFKWDNQALKSNKSNSSSTLIQHSQIHHVNSSKSNESMNGPMGTALSLHANDAASWKTPWERQDIGVEDKPPSSLLASFTIFYLHIILAIDIQNIRRFVKKQDGTTKVKTSKLSDTTWSPSTRSNRGVAWSVCISDHSFQEKSVGMQTDAHQVDLSFQSTKCNLVYTCRCANDEV